MLVLRAHGIEGRSEVHEVAELGTERVRDRPEVEGKCHVFIIETTILPEPVGGRVNPCADPMCASVLNNLESQVSVLQYDDPASFRDSEQLRPQRRKALAKHR